MRILAVEDEPILLRQLTLRIREALPESEIVAFDNADDAIVALPSGVIHIAFLDIAIGNMTGGLYIQCFGDFEVFYDGKPVESFTKRSKELLAYLINKAGILCPVSEIRNTIFKGSSDSYIRVAKKDLVKVFSDIGQEDILVKGWGVLGIDRKKLECDYFDFLDGKPSAVNQYKGVYMAQYDWAQRNSRILTDF